MNRRSTAMRAAKLLSDHPIAGVAALALAIRFVVLLAVTLHSGGALFEDDGTYLELASQRASGATADWDSNRHWLYDATATFLVP